jgi:hypothetical protein
LNTSGLSKKRNSIGVKQKCAKEINVKAHLHAKLGPSTDVDEAQAHPRTNHVKASPPGCGRTRGAAAPQGLPARPDFHRRMHGGMHRWFRLVSYFIGAKLTSMVV